MKKEHFAELLTSIRQGGAILKGRIKPARTVHLKNTNIRSIRNNLHLSQDKFAQLLGISAATLKNWEQGHRKPQGPARVLLGIAALHPEILAEMINYKMAA